MGKSKSTIQWVEECAKKIMEEHGQHSPQFIMIMPDNKVELYLANFDSDESKEAMLQTMRNLVQVRKVTEYFFVTESWKVVVDKGEMPTLRPKDHPNRIECLLIHNYRKDMKNTEIMIDYTRDKDNKVVWGERLVSGYAHNKAKDRIESKSRWNFFIEDIADEKLF